MKPNLIRYLLGSSSIVILLISTPAIAKSAQPKTAGVVLATSLVHRILKRVLVYIRRLASKFLSSRASRGSNQKKQRTENHPKVDILGPSANHKQAIKYAVVTYDHDLRCCLRQYELTAARA